MRTINRFDTALAFVLSEEGGYVNHPNDPGGETNCGISKRQYPDLDIKNLTRAQASAIYRRDYWDAFRCGELPPGIDIALFDAAVQHRPKNAAMLIQHAVGASADGVIGSRTIALAKSATNSNAAKVINKYFVARAGLYVDLITADSRKAVFRNGWFARLFRLHGVILINSPLER